MLEFKSDDLGRHTRMLSIVVPTWNYAEHLEACLRSVITQMTGECELVVIDDGSTDNTLAILQAFDVPEGLHVYYLRQENAGPAAARNKCIEVASGRWVMPLDSDDVLCDGAISSVLRALETHPGIELILGAYYVVDQCGTVRLKLPAALAESSRQRVEDYLLTGKTSMVHGACVFPRVLLQDCPYSADLRQGEDIVVFAKALMSHQILRLNKPLVIIKKHKDSLRHDASMALAHGHKVTEMVFAQLPDEFFALRRPFEAKRALSTFRRCYRAKRYDVADQLYRQAWKLSWQQSVRWSYLSKWLRMQLTFCFQKRG